MGGGTGGRDGLLVLGGSVLFSGGGSRIESLGGIGTGGRVGGLLVGVYLKWRLEERCLEGTYTAERDWSARGVSFPPVYSCFLGLVWRSTGVGVAPGSPSSAR